MSVIDIKHPRRSQGLITIKIDRDPIGRPSLPEQARTPSARRLVAIIIDRRVRHPTLGELERWITAQPVEVVAVFVSAVIGKVRAQGLGSIWAPGSHRGDLG